MSILNSFGRVWKQRSHLFLRLAVILSALVTHSVLVADLLAGLDAQQDIMRISVLGINIMNIICCDQLDAGLAAHPHKACIHKLLLRNSMVLKLKKEVALSEYILIHKRRLFCLRIH